MRRRTFLKSAFAGVLLSVAPFWGWSPRLIGTLEVAESPPTYDWGKIEVPPGPLPGVWGDRR